MSETEVASGQGRLAELRTSARGWHGVQLATIGFVGLCGVLQRGRPDNPTWLQVVAGILALAALVLACAGTFLVARVAWPLYGGAARDGPGDLARDAARLKRGLVYTFAAAAVVALATASGWWPQPARSTSSAAAAAAVSVDATNGQRVCGTLVDVGPGRIGVTVNGSPVAVSLADVATVTPANGC